MERQFILLKQFTHSSDKGLTLVEVLTSMVVAAVVLPLALSTLVTNRQLYLEDQARTEVNQNLRAAMDLVGTDIKQAGERIQDARFPAIEVTGGSQLLLRRRINNPNNVANSDLPILPVCQVLRNGTNDVVFMAQSVGTPPPGCVPNDTDADGMPDNLELWRDYRCSRDGVAGCQGNAQEQVRAHIYDGNGNIQPFNYTGENATFEIQKDAVAWAREYSTSSSLYLLEERQFSLDTDENILQLTIDGSPNPLRLVNKLSEFQVQVRLRNGSAKTTFPEAGDSWKQVSSIQVDLRAHGQTTGPLKVKNLDASGRFFPRNALSR